MSLFTNSSQASILSRIIAKEMQLNAHGENGEKAFLCKYCGEIFKGASDLVSHEIVHTGYQKSCRNSSDTTFAKIPRQHKRSDHVNRSVACSQCDKVFTTSASARRHEGTHTGERPYACVECDKTFTQAPSLKHHMLVHMDEHPYACSQCERKFRKLFDLRGHEKLHGAGARFSCSDCGVKFTTIGALQQHIKLCIKKQLCMQSCTQNMIPAETTLTSESDSVRNKQLAMASKTKALYGSISETSLIGTNLAVANAVARPELSNKLTASHVRGMESISKDMHCSIPLDVQNKNACKSFDLQTLNLPFACSQCGKRFSQLRYKRRHEVLHEPTGEPSFSCNLCDQKFARHQYLNKHLEIHEKVRRRNRREKMWHGNFDPFVCCLCTMKFKRLDYLTQHERRHHNAEEMFMCTHCKEKFIQLVDLQLHRRICMQLQHFLMALEQMPNFTFKKSDCGTGQSTFDSRSETEMVNEVQVAAVRKLISIQESMCASIPCKNSISARQKLFLKQQNDGQDRPFVCSQCGWRLKKLHDLTRHQKLVHMEPCRYTCDRCGKMHRQQNDLNEHLRRHENIYRFVCGFCNKYFTRLLYLSRHEISKHSTEKLFKCAGCALSFTNLLECHQHRKDCMRHKRTSTARCGSAERRSLKHNASKSKQSSMKTLQEEPDSVLETQDTKIIFDQLALNYETETRSYASRMSLSEPFVSHKFFIDAAFSQTIDSDTESIDSDTVASEANHSQSSDASFCTAGPGHMKASTTDNDNHGYACRHCKRRFTLESQLHQHEQWRKCPYAFDACGSKFLLKVKLAKHLRKTCHRVRQTSEIRSSSRIKKPLKELSSSKIQLRLIRKSPIGSESQAEAQQSTISTRYLTRSCAVVLSRLDLCNESYILNNASNVSMFGLKTVSASTDAAFSSRINTDTSVQAIVSEPSYSVNSGLSICATERGPIPIRRANLQNTSAESILFKQLQSRDFGYKQQSLSQKPTYKIKQDTIRELQEGSVLRLESRQTSGVWKICKQSVVLNQPTQCYESLRNHQPAIIVVAANRVWYKCADCDKHFPTWILAQKHGRRVHVSLVLCRAQLGCGVCGKVFGGEEQKAKECFYVH